MNLKEDDFVEHLFISSTHNYILFFSNKGKVYRLKVHELPMGSRQSKGQSVVNVLPFSQGEEIAAVITAKDFKEHKYLIMGTKKGRVKKTEFGLYNTARRDGIIAISLRDGDELIGAKLTTGESEIILVSTQGQSIRFSEEDVRPMGRTASGVLGMRVPDDHEVLSMEVARDDASLFVITANGFGKRTLISQYRVQHRGGRGVKTIKATAQKGRLAGVKMVMPSHELMIVSSEGIIIRLPADGISQTGRDTQGVKIMNLKKDDKVSAIARVVATKNEVDEDDEGESEEGEKEE